MSSQELAEPFPLTEIQYAYWVGRGPNFVLGNVAPHAYFELEGRRLDHATLAAAWNKLVARHGMLRAVVSSDGRQRILPDVPAFDIPYLDLSQAPAQEAADTLAGIREEMSHRVYTAADWPLWDIRLTRLAGHDRLHISLDLLMVDLASVALLFSEWQTLCQHPDRELAPVDVSFRDYVLALEAGADSPRSRRSLEYWTSRATTLAPPPDLPLGTSPVAVHKPTFSHREFHLPPEEWKALQDKATSRGLTPTAVLAAVFSDVLAAWSGSQRFTLNLTLFNRLPLLLASDGAGHRGLHPHLRRVVGDFTSICLLEMDASGGVTFEEQVRRTQRQLSQDLRHRYVSALHTLRERRRLGLQSGFETMPVVFTSGLGTVADVTGPRDYFGDITYRISQTPQVWLDHQVVDFTGSLDLTWDAVEELFPPGLLDDMFATYTGLVALLASDDSAWGSELAVIPPPSQLAVRAAVNQTAGPLPNGLLHEPFARQALWQPDRPAVITSAGTLSYGELAARASAIAAAVHREAGGPLRDRLVGVTLPKGADQVAAAYGVLLAGGAYLPVAPALPAQRRERILTDGGAGVVVTDQSLATLSWPAGTRTVRADEAGDPGFSRAADPADLAYVIFTSGSTGTPKGVMIEHRAALNTVLDINERFGITAADRVFGLAELGFDLSVYDLFGPLGVGAALVLPDQDQLAEPAHWAGLMREHGVTVWNSVPAQMQMLVEHLEAGAEIPEGLRVVLLSGDWIPVDLPDRIRALWPQANVISLGGATEAAIWSIYHEVGEVPKDAASVPYGIPLRNQAFHVLDANLRPSPVWVPGELYIEGAGLARGYWADAAKTAASFIEHDGVRLYRTGDFGRYLPDGTIQFLGRRDGQVKIGGHRIELGEIESVLGRHPGVDRAVAVKSAEDGANARLLAFVTPARDDDSLFSTEYADGPAVDARWAAVTGSTVDSSPSTVDSATLLAGWERVNQLHAAAAAAAFRALGLPYQVGERFQPAAAVRGAGVADRYRRWVDRAVGVLVERGYLREAAGGLDVARELPAAVPEEVAAAARAALRDSLGIPDDLVDWLLALAGQLKGILTQDIHSAELYANDRTPEVYQRLYGPTYEVAAGAVRDLVASWPADQRLRVLEVGAGYGSLTGRILPLFAPDRTGYLFTDISTYFTERAREEFGEYEFLSYGLYNLDSTPDSQGYEDLTADLVIAASVLHDTTRIGRGLRSLRSALAPGGLLLLVENTVFHPWFDLTMGLQQGFDGYEDTELRTAHPLLDRDQWRTELLGAGFDDVAVLTLSTGDGVGFDVLVARAGPERRRFDAGRLADFAAQALPKHMVPARIYALEALPLSATGKVDRGALAKAGARGAARDRPAKPPTTDRQRKLVEIWRTVLGLSRADLADDFLESGGDSLLAARLVANIQSAFSVTVPVSTVLQYPTVEALDGYLEQILGPSDLLEDS
jgi:pyochelin synthetase